MTRNEVCTHLCSQMIGKKKRMQRFQKTGNSQLANYRNVFLAGKSLRTDQETKDVQDLLKGLLFRHFICTLYFCFNIEFYIVLNFVTFSCSGNSTGFILIGIPEVSLFLNGPIILSDMAYLNPYIFIILTQDGIEYVIHIISST